MQPLFFVEHWQDIDNPDLTLLMQHSHSGNIHSRSNKHLDSSCMLHTASSPSTITHNLACTVIASRAMQLGQRNITASRQGDVCQDVCHSIMASSGHCLRRPAPSARLALAIWGACMPYYRHATKRGSLPRCMSMERAHMQKLYA